MGKKKDDDAAADFFGDENVDWLGGESAAPLKAADAESGEAEQSGEDDWADTISPPLDSDSGTSDAPTLVFSAIDTLPPQMAPRADEIAEALAEGADYGLASEGDDPSGEVDEATESATFDPISLEETLDASSGAVEDTFEPLPEDDDDLFGIPDGVAPPAIGGDAGGSDSLSPWNAVNPSEFLKENPEYASALEESSPEELVEDEASEPIETSENEAQVAQALVSEDSDSGSEAVDEAAENELDPLGDSFESSEVDGEPEVTASSGFGEAGPSMPPMIVTPDIEEVAVPKQLSDDAHFEAWQEAVDFLSAEAHHDGERCSQYRMAGALIALERLGDVELATRLANGVDASELDAGEVHEFRSVLAAEVGDWATAIEEKIQEAGYRDPIVASEVWRDIALVHAHQLNDPDAAIAALTRAVAVQPSDVISWTYLRDFQASRGRVDERAQSAKILAELAGENVLGAEAMWELGCVRAQQGDAEAARAAFEGALARAEGDVPLLVTLASDFESNGEFRALGDLLAAEAEREGQVDASHWWLAAARAYRKAGSRDRSTAAYAKAVEVGGPPFAVAEQQGYFVATGRNLEAAGLVADNVLGQESAGMAYLRGLLLELGSGDVDTILQSYRQCLEQEPASRPAEDAILRILRRAGRTSDMKSLIEADTGVQKAASRMAAQIVQLGEAYLKEESYELAGDCFERVLSDFDAGYRAAIDGLLLAAAGAGNRDRASAAFVALASVASIQTLRADYLCLSGLVHLLGDEFVEDGVNPLLEASGVQANHAIAYGLRVWIAGRTGDWNGVVRASLDSASGAMQAEEKAAMLYRAARLLYAQGESEEALGCLESCLKAHDKHTLARMLQCEISAELQQTQTVTAFYRRSSLLTEDDDQVYWDRIAAAAWSIDNIDDQLHADLDAALSVRPSDSSALALGELVSLVSGDTERLLAMYEKLNEPEYTFRRVELEYAQGAFKGCQSIIAKEISGEAKGFPVSRFAHVAGLTGDWSLSAEVLGTSQDISDRLQQARVYKDMLHEPEMALPIFQSCFAEQDDSLTAAVGLARVAHHDASGLIAADAHSRIAQLVEGTPHAVAHALWASGLYSSNNVYKERQMYQFALAHQPESLKAYEGAIAASIRLNDADALVELVETFHPQRRSELAQDLERVGEDERAEAIWRQLARKSDLAAKIYHERCLTRLQMWPETFQSICAIRDHVTDPASRETLDRRRRDVLSNLIQDVDDSWGFYSQLHEEVPSDRWVQKNLASLAGERDDPNKRVHFLGLLSDSAEDSNEAAAYQRDAAETLIAEEEFDGAKAAYYKALEFVPENQVTLNALKQLSERVGDWTAVVDVLNRKIALESGMGQVELQREAANTIEVKIGDGLSGVVAWQALLKNSPHDRDALVRLKNLSEALAKWEIFVETGHTLAELSVDAERSRLFREIGIVCYDHLDMNDAHDYLETAIASDFADIHAAARLEILHRDRGDWQSVVRVLLLQAELHTEVDLKVEFFEKAAKVNSEVRHDRDAAAGVYETLLGIDPQHGLALQFLCAYLFDTGEHDKAFPLYQRLEPFVESGLDLDDFDVRIELSEFYFSYATILGERERDADALVRFERVLELNPTHLASLGAVAPLYVDSKEWRKAENAYRQLLQLTGGQGDRKTVAEMYTQLGLVEHALGNDVKGYKRFNKALELVPNHIEALRGMALILEDRQDWSTLLNVYNNVIYHATDPEDVAYAYINKGRVLDESMSRPDKAAQHYERGLSFEVRQAESYLRLAELAMRRMDYAAAGTHADKGLAFDDTDAGIEAGLKLAKAAALQFDSQHEQGQQMVREAIAVLPALIGDIDPVHVLADLESVRKHVVARLAPLRRL